MNERISTTRGPIVLHRSIAFSAIGTLGGTLLLAASCTPTPADTPPAADSSTTMGGDSTTAALDGSTGSEATSGLVDSGTDVTSSTGSPLDDTSSSTGEPEDELEFCPPTLGEDALHWKAEYDVFFSDPDSMRRHLDDLPSGTGHWGQTYTLWSLASMYELTGDVAYLHELIFHGYALRDIAGGALTWPTGVCGNTFEHSTVVIDARLLTPLLRAAYWMDHSRLADDAVPIIDSLDLGGMTYAEVSAEFAELATDVLAGHESELVTIAAEAFGPYEGSASEYYRFSDSYTCVAGDLMPFNYANSAGTAYAALWRLTGDEAAREHAERLMIFWWNRTHAHEPSPGASRSRWWGYRGVLGENFDPDAFPGDDGHRPEDVGHADMSSTFAAHVYALGLEGQNGTRIDQLALASKRWIDRAVGNGTAVSYYITNDDENGEWPDMFDHLPMSCYRASILEDLSALAPAHLTNDAMDYRRSHVENLAELAFFSEYAGTAPACGPSCGDGVCSGPEDCVGCPEDCGACPLAGC